MNIEITCGGCSGVGAYITQDDSGTLKFSLNHEWGCPLLASNPADIEDEWVGRRDETSCDRCGSRPATKLYVGDP